MATTSESSATRTRTHRISEQTEHLARTSSAFVSSASPAALYPVKGVLHFIRHRDLWRPFAGIVLPCAALSVGVLAAMFTLTYLPQAALLSVVQLGPLGFVSAVPLVLSESAMIINILAKAFIIEDRVMSTFDAVLVQEGQTRLVERGRVVHGSGTGKKLGKALKKPLAKFSPSALTYYLMTLPLQFIPVAGAVIFFVLNGAKTGPSLHSRYFQLKGLSSEERKSFVSTHRGAYTAMGTVALLFNTIPLLNIFFAFTNACGAALFAADIERGTEGKEVVESTFKDGRGEVPVQFEQEKGTGKGKDA
ncbi:hypothetical protein PLICRDRAFT_168216 [Plicaturopsis crispa FD-325 SS-3]|uniref:Outer spore wall protein RRT8 n=1 Tax=Plicaturopsis crispa FD-325 SS-3 TaxID=944288 RepID=A0A0C9SKQ0_PLICR|nr:hypothetical protein PLICRDRAFT_168216 [Plicaturopsis crispa FD-325 SS-3]